MKDLTLKFVDRAEFSAFLDKIEWHENETIQDAILLDVIGFTYTVVARSEDGEDICRKNDGFFVNVRVISDKFDTSIFADHVVEIDDPIREWA